MYPTHVFILASRPLFAQGVKSLLSNQPGIQVIGVVSFPPGEGPLVDPDVLTQVQQVAPDVVIIEAGGGGQSLLVAQVLESIPGAKVVALTLEDNRIHTYYQQMKHGRRVEDLLEAIREPTDWHGLSPGVLRLLVMFQGQYGERILENVSQFAPETWTIDAWCVPSDLSPASEASNVLSACLPDADLLLSLVESRDILQLVPSVVEHTNARAVIAPVDNVDWLPNELIPQLHVRLTEMGVTAVFPKPFCSLTEQSYIAPGVGSVGDACSNEIFFDDPWIGEFARYFGRPKFRIECDNQWIIQVDLERDAACGCARAIVDQLAGVDVQKSIAQAGLFHRNYPCMAAARIESDLEKSLLQVAGDFVREAVETQVRPCLPQTVTDELGDR
ncbi:MAG: hypothetical protein GY832_08845 [Chloroflexi bacterium]|nr:hypothetical protein [Chloroflexota bacterium]